MTREEHIENLFSIMDSMPDDTCGDWRDSIAFAISALQQEPCTDAISRQAVAEVLLKYAHSAEGKAFAEFLISQINDLPPVKPAEKVGEWTTTITPLGKCCICSECGSCPPIEYRFCPYCGAKMQDVNNAGTSRGQNNNT